MRGRPMRLLLGVSLCALASGCNIKSHHNDAPQAVVTPPIVLNPPGTTLTAAAKSGFLSATVTSTLGAPLAFTVDNQTQNATITQYDNGNIGLSAPDLSPTRAQDQVTFTGQFTQQTSVQAAGGFFSAGTSAAGASVTLYQGQQTLELQYSDFGLWKSSATTASAPQTFGVYAVGNATPASAVPKTGSVIFTGNALGTVSNTQGSGIFGGLASLTVNFASNGVTGSISDIRAANSFTALPSGSANAIAFTGTLSGSSFSGQSSIASAAGTAFDLTGASGSFGGSLYGPGATEAVGVFSLAGGNSQAQVIGSFGATQSFASNDISSAIPQLSAVPNGLPLTANFGSGFISATQTITTTPGATTSSLTVDSAMPPGATTPISVPPANFVYYSNGSLSLQAPNIPYFTTQQTTNNNQTVQFTASAFGQSPAANATASAVAVPYGTIQASAVASVPGFPSIPGDQVTLYRVGGAVGLQYSDFGEWTTGQVASATPNTVNSSYGVYGVGVATPTGQMPTTGTALYTGSAIGVVGYKANTTATTTTVATVTGVADVNVNFGTKAVTGGIVGLRSPSAGGNPAYLNDVLFTGTLAGNSFSGTTAAGTNTGNIDLTGATGKFGGGFYGPNAKEITGTFSLTAATNGSQLIGSFGAHK